MGFCGALTILFIGLKLTGYIAWSWWLILSPLALPFMVAALFPVFLFLAAIFGVYRG